jgi:hypothetical protein
VRRRWPTSRDCYYRYDCAATYTVVGNSFLGIRIKGKPLTSLPLHELPTSKNWTVLLQGKSKIPWLMMSKVITVQNAGTCTAYELR